jgi:hypothetical protein
MEFNKKRQEIQPTNIRMIQTHSVDGHPLKLRTKSLPRKIAKIVKKVSQDVCSKYGVSKEK